MTCLLALLACLPGPSPSPALTGAAVQASPSQGTLVESRVPSVSDSEPGHGALLFTCGGKQYVLEAFALSPAGSASLYVELPPGIAQLPGDSALVVQIGDEQQVAVTHEGMRRVRDGSLRGGLRIDVGRDTPDDPWHTQAATTPAPRPPLPITPLGPPWHVVAPYLPGSRGPTGGGGDQGGFREGTVVPSTGGEGTILTIGSSGPKFAAAASAYEAEDVLVLGDTYRGLFGRGLSKQGTSFLCELGHLSKYAKPNHLTLLFGEGSSQAIPDFMGTTYPEPIWSWSATANAKKITTETVFKPDTEDFFAPCADPEYKVELGFELVNGELVVKLPEGGSCLNDTFSAWIRFETWTATQIAVDLPASPSLSQAGWNQSAPLIAWALNSALMTHGCEAVYQAVSGEHCIVIRNLTGGIADWDPNSRIRIEFDPALHAVFEEIQGNHTDDFVGTEPTSPHAAFDAATLNDPLINRVFDQVGIDLRLRETFDAYGTLASDGPARSAKLETRLRGDGAQTDTDAINFGWSAGVFEHSILMNQLAQLSGSGPQWSPGDLSTFCFDLSALINQDGTTDSVMNRVAEDEFHVLIQDDTSVDYMILRVLRCVN